MTLSNLPRNLSNGWSHTNRGVRNSASQPPRDTFQFCSIRSLVIGLMVFVCTWAASINAQQSEEVKKVTDACDIEITPIDPQQLAADPEKTKARVIARMLLDMDRCIGAQSSRIASARQGIAPGATPGSMTNQSGSEASSSAQTDRSKQAQTQANQASGESATNKSDSTNTPIAEPVDSSLADVLKSLPDPTTTIQNGTSVFDFDADDELVFDDYAKTLHEAYLAETDPVLKEALGKELTNYLNNKKR
ncbi:MAG: hypothetical protein OXG15_14530 [Gammaproteobacteria bacterium]|nr:hypothetical protein [Gammaproteobacteria bacterium]